MDRMSRVIGPLMAASLLLTLCSCAMTEPNSSPTLQASSQETLAPVPPAEAVATADPSPSATEADADADADAESSESEKDGKKKAKEARERQRKLARLTRDLELARLNRAKAQLVLTSADVALEETLARTAGELEITREKLRIFDEVRQPNRIARAELNLQHAKDRLQEDTEELKQLELMYADEQFADQTKEIVIDRAKRQLQRTRRDLELRQQELQTLAEVTLPLERRELELQVAQKEQALAKIKRDHETQQIDHAVAVKKAEAELIRLTDDIADTKEEIAEAEETSPATQETQP